MMKIGPNGHRISIDKETGKASDPTLQKFLDPPKPTKVKAKE